MKQIAITAFSLACAVGAAPTKYMEPPRAPKVRIPDAGTIMDCLKRVNRTPARNEAHRRHGRHALGLSRRQHRILIHALRTGE